jgi:hypothetical protein
MKHFLQVYFIILGVFSLVSIIIILFLEFNDFGISDALGVVCNNDAEFTRIVEGKGCASRPYDNSCYYETVLVKNINKNTVKQSKIMIAYFDSAGLSVNELLKMPEINYCSMFFYKSTRATRKHFVENKKVSTYNGNETYLGSVALVRCKDDPAKLQIDITRNLGTADNIDKQGPATKNEFLQNECDPDWYEANKDNELVKYYMELREKRNAKH